MPYRHSSAVVYNAATATSDVDQDVGLSGSHSLLVVSPHYDDAVFSCGHALARAPSSLVVTVCTALPPDATLVTDWDRRCGFIDADQAMSARALENTRALACLGAHGIDIGFLDDQYADKPPSSAELLSDTLAAVVLAHQPGAVFMPLGLFHQDHILTSDAVLSTCPRFPAVQWYAYADIPYCKRSELVQERLTALTRRGINAQKKRGLLSFGSPHAVSEQEASRRKRAAVGAYRSQLKGLTYPDAAPILGIPEQYWQLQPAPETL